MNLNEKEKRCFELCKKWSRENVKPSREEVMKELAVDHSEYNSLIRKMEEIGAIVIEACGGMQEYGAYFKIQEPALLQKICQMIDK